MYNLLNLAKRISKNFMVKTHILRYQIVQKKCFSLSKIW